MKLMCDAPTDWLDVVAMRIVVLCQLLGLFAECFLLLVCLRTHSQTWRHRRQNEKLTIAGHNKGTVQDSPLDTYTIKCNCSH